MRDKFVILGNGIAGLTAAETIRQSNSNAEIIMISEEPIATYIRPLLSKTFLRTFNKQKILTHDSAWYKSNEIEQRLGKRIKVLSTENRLVTLEDDSEIAYDTCIYALGARSFMPPIKGADKKGVVTIRSAADLDSVRNSMVTAKDVVVVGGGVIGLEIACELKLLGCRLTILEAEPRLMGRLLDEESANVLTNIIQQSGIESYAGIQIDGMLGDSHVTGVRLCDGRIFKADLVIVSCGVRANYDLAKSAGVACDRGILVNDAMETDTEGVYAAGDCIQLNGPNPGLWQYARLSAEVAGENAAKHNRNAVFSPRLEAVSLTVMGTSLFAAGCTEEKAGVRVESCFKVKSDTIGIFKVNRAQIGAVNYEKRFYDGDKLTGAILVGDLSHAAAIKKELEGRT